MVIICVGFVELCKGYDLWTPKHRSDSALHVVVHASINIVHMVRLLVGLRGMKISAITIVAVRLFDNIDADTSRR